MKRDGILNAELSYLVATMGHSDSLMVVDAGWPIPDAQRCDVSLSPGVPSLLQVVGAILSEMSVERAIIDSQLASSDPEIYASLRTLLTSAARTNGSPMIEIEDEVHDTFKLRANAAKGIVRTGECTAFANVVLVGGLWAKT